MKRNLLVTLADKNYIDQAKQLFSSVYWNAGWKGDYMLLAHEIPEKDLKWFRDKGIFIKKCKSLSKKGWGNWPPILLDKFYLFTPEFKKWKNIIYLDADIIVRASLDDLIKIKGFASARVLDNKQRIKYYFRDELKHNKQFLKLKKKYNIFGTAFNSGVMVFSSDVIKKNMFSNLIILFKNYKEISKGDDPIINILFHKKWKKLPVVYDILPRYLTKIVGLHSSQIQGIILHFILKKEIDKPWNPKNYFYKEWKANLKKAELINLNNIPQGKKWNSFRIKIYSYYLRIIYFWYFNCPEIKRVFNYLINTPERLFGKFGIFLKKHNSDLYNKLKKIEQKIRK